MNRKKLNFWMKVLAIAMIVLMALPLLALQF